jgi:hypothetical protein
MARTVRNPGYGIFAYRCAGNIGAFEKYLKNLWGEYYPRFIEKNPLKRTMAQEFGDHRSGYRNAPKWYRKIANKKYRRKNNQKLGVDKEEFEPVEWKRSVNWLWF